MQITIGDRAVGERRPTYFVADIAANHDGDLERAKRLIMLAKEAGADAAKFQNFRASRIVSDYGFKQMGAQTSHQSSWRRSVYEVYEEASLPFDWTPVLKQECERVGIEYLSTPYDFEAVDMLEDYVVAYKIGSGDITWLEFMEYIASKNRPVLLATGASDIGDVQRAVDTIRNVNPSLVLMQCNTNYTASDENFNYVNLRVLEAYRALFPDVVLGLSDHTPGHATTLGAVALGASVIEKHFTDDIAREGPDHPFSMTPSSWNEMVERTRELEHALGSPEKRVAENERETAIIQRRCLRAARDIGSGDELRREMITALRPATPGAILPYEIDNVVGKRTACSIPSGKALRWTDLQT